MSRARRHSRRLYNNTNARDTAQLDRVPGSRQRRAVQRRRPGPQQQDVVFGLRRELRPHRPVHVPARRHVRRVQGGRVPERHPAHLLVERLDAVHRQRRQRPDGDLPAGGAAGQSTGRLEQFQAGLRPARRGRLRRVAEEQPLVLPRRRQPGHVQRHQGRLGAPTARARATATPTLRFPTNTKTSNWGVEGGYQTSKATFALRWDYSKFENDNTTLQWTNPFFGGNKLDSTYLAPDNTFNKFTVSGNYRDLPWRVGDLGALHVGEDDERRAARADGAQHRRRLQRHAARREQLQRREHQPVVRSSHGPRRPSPISTRASTTTGRSCRTSPR